MSVPPPLYVDLDGTLCATDTLHESLALFLKQSPLRAWKLPLWAAQGKTVLKAQVAKEVELDAAHLPYRPEVLAKIEEQRQAGGRVVLATAAHESIATAVAHHFGIFDATLATTEQVNLRSENKLAAIRADCGDRPFAYVGDSKADWPLFRAAAHSYFAGTANALWRKVDASVPATRLTPQPKPGSLAKLLRPHQWAKNFLVFVPLFVAHKFQQLEAISASFLAFFCFSLLASSIYVLNDAFDIPGDRRHSRKRLRPLASGAVTLPQGIVLGLSCFAASFGVAVWFLPQAFLLALTLYLGINLAYTLFLKQKIVVDVIVLAGLYTVRIFAGATAIHVVPSEWLLAFSLFIFTSLAMVKRYTELAFEPADGKLFATGRRYFRVDAELFRSAGPAFGIAAVLVFCLYITSPAVTLLYRSPKFLWGVSVIMVYWITRVWFLANRGQIEHDPVLFALRDKASLACGGAIVMLTLLGS